MGRYLDISGTRRFYDRLGKGLDSQAFYEDPALDLLIAHGRFGSASHVFDFGCGTGRLAERLLTRVLPLSARLAACDVSARMLAITRARLAPFSDRITLWQSGEEIDFTPGNPPFDRICSSFVLDLLAPGAVDAVLSEAARTLSPGGLLCLSNLSHAARGLPWLVSSLWGGLANLAPSLVGGCHPSEIAPKLDPAVWRIEHHAKLSAWGIPIEVTVAARR